MTVAATLSVSARAEGFLARLRVVLASPVVEIDGVTHVISWWGTHSFVVAPGQHTVRVWYKRHDSTAGHAALRVVLGPGETLRLVATLGRGGFSTDVTRVRPGQGPAAA